MLVEGGGKLPRVDRFDVGDDRGRVVRLRRDVERDAPARRADQPRILSRFVGMVDESGAAAQRDVPTPIADISSSRVMRRPRTMSSQPTVTATHVVVRVTPSIAPIPSVTRRPSASSVEPSMTAMKSYGPVTASRFTRPAVEPLSLPRPVFTDFVLPAAVSISTYAFTRARVFAAIQAPPSASRSL